MNEDYYNLVEEKYGFLIPDDYRELEKRGFMFLDDPAQDHDFTIPGKGYLWLNDMEWHTPEEIFKFEFADYHLPGFVPFAFTGGGDYWCWQIDVSTGLEARVVLCPHDFELGTIYAQNFHSALYRQILEYACYGIESVEDQKEARAFLKRWSIDLACIFPKSWCKRILALSNGEIVSWIDRNTECFGLIKPESAKEIEASDIGFSLMDTEFQ